MVEFDGIFLVLSFYSIFPRRNASDIMKYANKFVQVFDVIFGIALSSQFLL